MVFLKKRFEACREERKKRDRKATEESILRAASCLFAEKGFENTRTMEIAKSAGANEALIARYFGGKDGLLAAILKNESTLQEILKSGDVKCAALQAFPKGKTAKEFAKGILAFFELGRTNAKEKEQFMRIASSRALVDPEMAEIVRTKVIAEQTPLVVEGISTYFPKGTLTEDEKQAIAMLICSSNFNFNFMGRLVYRMDEKKIDLAMKILAESLQQYVSK